MKALRGSILFILTVVFLCLSQGALGEQVRVVTPGGALNMRRSADEKSKLVDSVPNKAMVEVEEEGEVWCKITYKRHTGYVKTDFLKLPSKLPGKTVYSDGGVLLLLSEPKEDGMILTPVGPGDALTIVAFQDGWAQAECGEYTGYAPLSGLTYQWETPQGGMEWMEEPGVMAQDCALNRTEDGTGAALAELTAGQRVTVTVLTKDACLIRTEYGCGYVKKSAVLLTGPEDTEPNGQGIAPMEAQSSAEGALRKKYKAFSKEKTYCVIQSPGEAGVSGAYRCGFFNDQDQYLFGALISAENGEALYTAEYGQFAAPAAAASPLPEGEMEITLSKDRLAVGEVLDISVSAWTNHESRYSLMKNGTEIVKTEAGQHFRAAYRPREAGEYTVIVFVKDEKGREEKREAAFIVDGDLPVQAGIQEVYSQKDGWWKDKQYRHSNLGKSGCAIFTLSHALQRMGIATEESLPEALAQKYAFCLIPGEGTSNELLINSASKAFGFATRGKLYSDPKEIKALLEGGALFTFSIARGHIALVSGLSADGAMVRVVDSAPLATFERIVDSAQYYQMRSGAYRAALSPDDLPGARWFFETDDYGGLEYYLTMEYVAKRGVRLIQPQAE